MNTIKEKVHKLLHKYGTSDPFKIAEGMNIPVIIEPLGDMWGYCHIYKRILTIHINCTLDYLERRFTCGHEIGHIILHPQINTPFLRAHTLFSIDRFEREANQFAVELLIPDSVICTYENISRSVYEIAASCGVPQELADLKKFK